MVAGEPRRGPRVIARSRPSFAIGISREVEERHGSAGEATHLAMGRIQGELPGGREGEGEGRRRQEGGAAHLVGDQAGSRRWAAWPAMKVLLGHSQEEEREKGGTDRSWAARWGRRRRHPVVGVLGRGGGIQQLGMRSRRRLRVRVGMG